MMSTEKLLLYRYVNITGNSYKHNRTAAVRLLCFAFVLSAPKKPHHCACASCVDRPTSVTLLVCFAGHLASAMTFKRGHRHVDLSGLVYMPYLHEWSPRTHNMVELLGSMSRVFGVEPPVRAGPLVCIFTVGVNRMQGRLLSIRYCRSH